jgi:hypothetical protein
LRDNPPKRTEFDFGELYDFIVFMVHSFLRPSEWKLLQHKHIGVFSDDGVEQLVISFPNSKTKNANGSIESTTTEVAADLYLKKILPRHDGKNDYLFFNDTQDRTYAGDKVSKMFKYFVKSAGLGTDAYGQAHTTYSLRAFFSLVSDPEDRRQRSFQIGEECENKRSDVRKVLPQASITADAGVYQAVADEAGLRGKQGSEGGAPSQTADWFGFSEGTADVLRVLMGHLQVRTKETDQDSQDLVGELNSLLS